MNYTTFTNLCKELNSKIEHPPIGIVQHANGNHTGIHIKTREFPISINESEFNYMYNFIIKHNLKNAFELSTGTGISTIAIGSAMLKTGGYLITLDSYYEDLYKISSNIPIGNYTIANIEEIKEKSDCYKFISQAVNILSLKNTVQIEIGWSPNDVKKLNEKRDFLDFVFLDCPKNDNEFERDIKSIYPFINKDKFMICVHDSHCYTIKSFELIKSLFNLEMIKKYEYFENTEYYSKKYFPLAIITNIS